MNLKYALVVAALALSATVFADDKDKPKKDTRPVVVSKTTEVKVEKKKGGNAFTRFWTDDVGGTIYHGLKKGSNKVANTFD